MTLHELLLRLLPPGPYSLEPDAVHVLELQAYATGLQDADDAVDAVLDEMFAATAADSLGRWEGMLGVIAGSGDTTAERRAAILAALRRRPSLNPGYIADIIGTLTQSTVTVTEYAPLVYGVAEYGDLYVDEWVFRFLVIADRVEAEAADAHWYRVQPVLDDIKPAHTEGIFCFSDAIYDDEWSPYDHCVY